MKNVAKKHFASKAFLFIITVIAIFISVSGFLTSGNQALISQIIFLPVTIYLIHASFMAIKKSSFEVVLSEKKGGLLFYLIVFIIFTIIAINNIVKSEKEKVLIINEKKTVISTPSPTPVEANKIMLTIETKDAKTKVSIRKAPSGASEIIGETFQDEQFVFIEKEKDWYKVEVEDGFGYIYKDYVSITEETK